MDTCTICWPTPSPYLNTATVTAHCNDREITAASNESPLHRVDVEVCKTVAPTRAQVGDTVKYTIVVRNCSTLPITQVKVTDTPAPGQLAMGNLWVNGTPLPEADLALGIVLPGIGPGSCAVITFQATVLEGAPDILENTAQADFDFTAGTGCCRSVVSSNTAVLTVRRWGLELQKTADRPFVTAGEPRVTYTLTASNTGSHPLEDVLVSDMLPAGLTYVASSTSVNGGEYTDLDPALGIPLGNLPPHTTGKVIFSAQAAF